jgi:photosystem II stability/assembly factor-like uncharacterized protein
VLVALGIYVRFAPPIPPPVDDPFAGRYRYFGLAVAPQHSNLIWMVGTYGQVRMTRDGGEHWVTGWTGVDRHLQDAVALDENTVIAVGNDNAIVRSEDGGKSWQLVSGVPLSEVENKLIRIRRAPDGALWVVGVMGAVLVSHDQGRSFVQVMPREDLAWNDVAFSERGTWLVGEFGRILFSPDGRQWQTVRSPVHESLMGVNFSGSRGVIVGLNGTALITEDSGETWTPLLADLAMPAFYAVAMDPSGNAVLGGALGRLFTLDHRPRPALKALDSRLTPADVVLEVEVSNHQLIALTETHILKIALPNQKLALSETGPGTDLFASSQPLPTVHTIKAK